MKRFLSLVFALMLTVGCAWQARAEEYLEFDAFRITKQDGMMYYYRDSEIADDPAYKTTWGYLADTYDTFVLAAFNDQFNAIVRFYPIAHGETPSSRAAIIEILETCYGEDAGLFEGVFTINSYGYSTYEVYQVETTGDQKITYDSIFILSRDGIVEISATYIEDRASDTDYAGNRDMRDFAFELMFDLHVTNPMD